MTCSCPIPERRSGTRRPRSATATAGSPRASAEDSEVAAAMATKDMEAAEQAPGTGERDLTTLIRVAVPERSIQADLRAVSIVWRRELIRFRTDRLRAVTSLVQPVLFLFILGTGLSRLAGRGLPVGVDFQKIGRASCRERG